jgi:eukaryotic-like serine/threonine-protein kinase
VGFFDRWLQRFVRQAQAEPAPAPVEKTAVSDGVDDAQDEDDEKDRDDGREAITLATKNGAPANTQVQVNDDAADQRIAQLRRQLEATAAGRAYATSASFASSLRSLDAARRSKAADELLAEALLISGDAGLRRWLAERLLHRGDQVRARAILEILQEDPAHAVFAHNALAELCERDGDTAGARGHYEAVLARDITDARARVRVQRLKVPQASHQQLARILGARAAGSRYAVVDELGRGGAATVYRARDRQLNREVALKIFHPRGQREERQARLLEEARIAGAFVHPHIVPILDIDEPRDLLAMVLCNGSSLQKRLQQGSVRTSDAVEWGAVLLRTLGDVHAAGRVHLDIKPSNLLFHDDQLMLCDFGSAGVRALGGNAVTRAYMAPEQEGGDVDVGPATDLYAVGMVVFECLEGHLPDRAGVVLSRLPRSPRRRALEEVLRSLLAADAAQRPASAHDAALALLQAGSLPSSDAAGAQLWSHVELLARRRFGSSATARLRTLQSHAGLRSLVDG